MNLLRKIFGVGIKNTTNRENWLRKELQKIPNGNKILDAGAGELQYKKYCSHLEYISQDFGQYNGVGDNAGLQMGKWDNSKLDIVSDIVSIPVENNFFDVIMCVEVFEHIPEPIKAVQEFSRILKPGGKLIVTTPFCSLTHFAPYFFYTGYTKYWYEKFLKANGFTIEEFEFNGNFFDYLIQEIKRSIKLSFNYTKMNKFLLSILAILSIIPFSISILILKIYSTFNKDSEKILCFGLGVVAKKN